jgi:hypothetical protein
MALAVMLPTVFTSHVCLGETVPFQLCDALFTVYASCIPGATLAAPPSPCRALRDYNSAQQKRVSEGARGQYRYWSGEHVASTYTLRIPPPLHLHYIDKPLPTGFGRADFSSWIVASFSNESALTPAETSRILRTLALRFPRSNIVLAPFSPTLEMVTMTRSSATRMFGDIPESVILLTAQQVEPHTNMTLPELFLRICARAKLFVTEPVGLAVSTFYFGGKHISLARLPDYITSDLLRHLSSGQQALTLTQTSEQFIDAVETRLVAELVLATASTSQPRGYYALQLRAALTADLPTTRDSSLPPEVVCRALKPWRQVLPFHGEFGPELITVLPHAYFMSQCQKLESTVSCGNLSSFYYFSPKHIVADCTRRSGALSFQGILGAYATASAITWEPPPVRAQIRGRTQDPWQHQFSDARRPRIFIFNRIGELAFLCPMLHASCAPFNSNNSM